RDEVRAGVKRWSDAGVTMLLVSCHDAEHVRSLADVVLG
ncbi:MAG: LLM class F420-dependent oxidoreductase, partial [Rhodococcus sp. (in: high G+C Gram-positive bacteria)]|nr:LLM class F420-dependent oxidoreductase [Rhodococcus sp. (in: high G+C Gram-positive bacteria)]